MDNHLLDETLAMVRAEVARAMAKHPPMNSAHEGHSVIREELEELWDHVKADTGSSNDAHKEAIQVACTAVRYCLDVCRRGERLEGSAGNVRTTLDPGGPHCDARGPSITLGHDDHFNHDNTG